MIRMKIKDICDLQNGRAFKPSDWGTAGLPIIRIQNLNDERAPFNYYGGKYNLAQEVDNGDLLFSWSGTPGTSFGAFLWNRGKGVLNQHIFKVIPKVEVDKTYLMYALNGNISTIISKAHGGVGLQHITKKELDEIEIQMVSISRQKKIVEILEKISLLIFLRKQQLSKFDELVKARFVEMFGDPVKNTMDWEIKPLSELGELNRGVSKARPRNSPELLGGPYPLIQTGEVANAKTYITSFNSTYSEKGLAQSKMWPKGTLCITIAANIAQTSILTFDACFPDSVVGFISRNMTNELFIHYWFSFFQKILDEQAPQVAQKNINLKILSELNVIVPPLSLQNRFAAFVERVDQQKQTIQQSLEKLELMKKALMQEYFG